MKLLSFFQNLSSSSKISLLAFLFALAVLILWFIFESDIRKEIKRGLLIFLSAVVVGLAGLSIYQFLNLKKPKDNLLSASAIELQKRKMEITVLDSNTKAGKLMQESTALNDMALAHKLKGQELKEMQKKSQQLALQIFNQQRQDLEAALPLVKDPLQLEKIEKTFLSLMDLCTFIEISNQCEPILSNWANTFKEYWQKEKPEVIALHKLKMEEFISRRNSRVFAGFAEFQKTGGCLPGPRIASDISLQLLKKEKERTATKEKFKENVAMIGAYLKVASYCEGPLNGRFVFHPDKNMYEFQENKKSESL